MFTIVIRARRQHNINSVRKHKFVSALLPAGVASSIMRHIIGRKSLQIQQCSVFVVRGSTGEA